MATAPAATHMLLLLPLCMCMQGILVGADGLSGEYFNSVDLSGSPVSTSVGPIQYNWGSGSPASGVTADNFSARWTGFITSPSTGSVVLTTRTDDGARLWIDDQLIIDDWTLHGVQDKSASFTMQAGKRYYIRMEYFEKTGGSVAQLLWSFDGGTTKVLIPATALAPMSTSVGFRQWYWNNERCSGTPSASGYDSLNHNWGTAAPTAGVTADRFSSRWMGSITSPTSGTMTLILKADDGIKLWVGDRLLLDAWKTQGPTEYLVQVPANTGERIPVRIDYFERTGGAVAQLQWSFDGGTTRSTIPASSMVPFSGLNLTVPSSPYISPASFEVFTEPNLVPTISGGTIQTLGSQNYAVNVPLSALGPTSVTITSGAETRTISRVWKTLPIDGPTEQAIEVRTADKLLLVTQGQQIVIRNGYTSTVIPVTAGTPKAVTFDTAGNFVVEGRTSGGVVLGTLHVAVYGVTLIPSYRTRPLALMLDATQSVFGLSGVCSPEDGVSIESYEPSLVISGSIPSKLDARPWSIGDYHGFLRVSSTRSIFWVHPVSCYTVDRTDLITPQYLPHPGYVAGGTVQPLRMTARIKLIPYKSDLAVLMKMFAHQGRFKTGAATLTLLTNGTSASTGEPGFVQTTTDPAYPGIPIGIFAFEIQMPFSENYVCNSIDISQVP